MNIENAQNQIDAIVDGTGLRLTRDDVTSLYARLFLVEIDDQIIAVAFPIDKVFGYPWSGPITNVVKDNGGLLFIRSESGEPDGVTDIQVYPLGPVKDDLKALGKESTVTVDIARSVANTQWGS